MFSDTPGLALGSRKRSTQVQVKCWEVVNTKFSPKSSVLSICLPNTIDLRALWLHVISNAFVNKAGKIGVKFGGRELLG